MKIKFILIFVLLQIYLIKSIDILKSEITYKSTSLFATTYNFAIGEIELSEDLYLYDWISCPSIETCPESNILGKSIDCSCDWTNANNCPPVLDPSCNKTCTIYPTTVCDDNWIVIEELDKLYTYTINETIQFRYKANITDCFGLSLKVNSIDGYGVTTIGSNFNSQYQRTIDSFQRDVIFNICPSEDYYQYYKIWTTDTYFITIKPTSPTYTFSLILHSLKISNQINQNDCKKVLPTHQCLNLTQTSPVYLNPQYFTVEIVNPGYYYFNFPTLKGKTTYYVSNDDNNPFPNEDNAIWKIPYDNGYLLLYLEPKDENTPSYVYITSIPQNSLYTISVNTYGKLYRKSILSTSAQSGYINLIGTSRLITPSGTIYTSSIGVKPNSLSNLYPQNDTIGLWPPLKSLFSKDRNLVNIFPEFLTFKPKSYQFLFLLDSTTNLKTTKYEDFKTILKSTLKFNLNIFDSNGLPINLNITFKENKLSNCQSKKYSVINQKINDFKKILSNSLSEDQAINYVYNLQALKLNSDFYSCENKMLDYIDTKIVQTTVLNRNCLYSINDPLWGTNPCCNDTLSYYECCNPNLQNVDVTIYDQFNGVLLKEECSSVECTKSVLTDYTRTISSIDGCTVPQYDLDQIGLNVATIVRECKNVLIAPYCTNNLECQSYGKGICDLYQRKCLPDFEIIDKEYVKCVLDSLPIGTLFYLINGTNSNSSMVDLLYDQSLIQDCIGTQSIMDRSLYEFYSYLLVTQVYDSISSTRCYYDRNCLDSTCLLHHDICFENIFVSDYYFKYDSEIGNCSLNGFCPQSSCLGNSNSSCQDLCDSTGSSFCGYCSTNSSDTQCHNVKEIITEQQCNTQNNICILANGQYYTNLTDSECKQEGSCTHSCGEKCVSFNDQVPDYGCFFISSVDEAYCIGLNGKFYNNDMGGICHLSTITNENDCIEIRKNYAYSYWVDCGSKKLGECTGPLVPYIGTIHISDVCRIKTIECKNESECLNSGGCSDEYYFSKENGITLLPDGLGKCIFNRTNVLMEPIKACQLWESDSPEGCYLVLVGNGIYSPPSNQSQCEDLGGRWWYKAQSKQECESKFGCKVLEPSYSPALPYNFKWNEMNEQKCTNCKNSLNQWSQKYQWTQAQWLPGVSVKPQWLSRQYVTNQIKNNVFSYESFYSKIKEAVGYQNSELYRTEAFCRIDRIQTSMNSLMCSCIDSNNASTCFDSSAPIIGQSKVCSGTTSEYNFDFGKIEFGENSIQTTCKTITVSQASKESYTSSLPESLASNFVSYNKPDNYAVFNMNKATIGTLLSDGLIIISDVDIENIKICFKDSSLNQFNERYPVLDLAIQIDSQSLPTPLEIEIFKNSSSSIDYYCANLTSVQKGSPIYFLINRYSSWKEKAKVNFTDDTIGLMYTLAVMFLLVGVFGFFELGIIIYRVIKTRVAIQLIQILIIFVTMFITIRSIYFFLLVDGKLQDAPVADYILVVLPTFIYFTSFTIIIAIWYVIVFLVLKRNTSTTSLINRLYRIIISANIVLYLFFIVIVLIFQNTNVNLNSDCGSRIPTPNVASKTQKGISLAYAIVQAFLSLIIGAAFIYLGAALYKSLHNTGKGNNVLRSTHQNKIFTLSIICSIAFILHCAFVLVLVTNINSMVFSFIGLTITEIIPAFTILYIFNPFQKEKTIENSDTNEMENKNKGIKKTKSKNQKSSNSNNYNNLNNTSSTSSNMNSQNQI